MLTVIIFFTGHLPDKPYSDNPALKPAQLPDKPYKADTVRTLVYLVQLCSAVDCSRTINHWEPILFLIELWLFTKVKRGFFRPFKGVVKQNISGLGEMHNLCKELR